MKILIIGGTKFLGHHLTKESLSKGHQVTLFNRGVSNPELFPEAVKLRGDREKDLKILENRQWDAVIDTCGYLPNVVKKSAELLTNNVSHYTFISSISVYTQFYSSKTSENSPVCKITEDELFQAAKIPTDGGLNPTMYDSFYPGLKASCEKTVEELFPGKTFIPRPGLIVGPYDYEGRFEYWCKRISEGGDVLCPDQLDRRKIKFIDCRDLTKWIVSMIESKETGIYNTTGPEENLTLKMFFDECKRVSGGDAKFIEASDEFLIKSRINSWRDFPYWIPMNDENFKGVFDVKNDKAILKGLTFRPISETIKDTISWLASKKYSSETKVGLARTQELKLIKRIKKESI